MLSQASSAVLEWDPLADLEYGSSHSLSRNASSSSDWQNTGLTRSEIEYRSRRGGHSIHKDARPAQSTSNSSELSPTCQDLRRVIGEDIPTLQKDVLELMDKHRKSHVNKVRKELRKLEKLNEFGGPQVSPQSPSIEDINRACRRPLRLKAQVTKKADEENRFGIEEKLEHLLDRFDLLTDFLFLKEGYKPGLRKIDTPMQMQTSDEDTENIVPRRKAKTSHQKQKPTSLLSTQPAEPVIHKRAICYFLPFGGKGFTLSDSQNEDIDPAYQDTAALQEFCRKNHPNFISNAQRREEILSQLKTEREYRAKMKRIWFQNQLNPAIELPSLERVLPPKGPRVMTTREMRDRTKKKYQGLPEVREQKLQKKAELEKRTNRIISQVFANKLRQGVLKGDPNFDPNKSVIRR